MQTPAQVARAANVTAQSIRNWSKEYADLLSPQASGEAGTRLFTDEDVQILCLIAALRKSGVPRDEVAERVRNREHVPPVVDVEATAQTEAQQGLNEAKTGQDGPFALQTILPSVSSRFEAVERRLDALAAEQMAQRHDMLTQLRDTLWWGRLQGAIVTLALAGALLWGLWLLAGM